MLIKRILTLSVILLFIGVGINPAKANNLVNDDLEVKIYAGHYGLNIGTFLRIDVINNKEENVTVFYNFTSNYLIGILRSGTNGWSSTYNETGNYTSLFFKYFLGFGIDLFSVSVEWEDKSVTRNGLWIGVRCCILFK